MSALGSQAAVDLFPVRQGIKSELLTEAVQAFHGAPLLQRLLSSLPREKAPPSAPLLLHCVLQAYSGLPSLGAHALPSPEGLSFTGATCRTDQGRHPYPRSCVGSTRMARSSGSPTLTASLFREASPNHGALPLPNFLPASAFGGLQDLDTHCSLDLGGCG